MKTYSSIRRHPLKNSQIDHRGQCTRFWKHQPCRKIETCAVVPFLWNHRNTSGSWRCFDRILLPAPFAFISKDVTEGPAKCGYPLAIFWRYFSCVSFSERLTIFTSSSSSIIPCDPYFCGLRAVLQSLRAVSRKFYDNARPSCAILCACRK